MGVFTHSFRSLSLFLLYCVWPFDATPHLCVGIVQGKLKRNRFLLLLFAAQAAFLLLV